MTPVCLGWEVWIFYEILPIKVVKNKFENVQNPNVNHPIELVQVSTEQISNELTFLKIT
jgi:predicted peroxiredoxin